MCRSPKCSEIRSNQGAHTRCVDNERLPKASLIGAAPDAPQWSLHIEFWGSLLLIGLVCCRSISRLLYGAAVAATVLAVAGNALILFLVGNLIAYAVRAPRIAQVLATRAAGGLATLLLIAGLVLDYSNNLPLLWRLDQFRVSGLW